MYVNVNRGINTRKDPIEFADDVAIAHRLFIYKCETARFAPSGHQKESGAD